MERRDFIKLSSAAAITATLSEKTGFSAIHQLTEEKPSAARYIWYSKDHKGRNLHACFRKTISIEGNIKMAELCLFADSSYRLFINGKYINFGPARFDPRYPMFDKYDIASHLIQGKNVICVAVNYHGMKTYKSMMSAAGMIAWGNVQTDKGIITLETKAGSWKCIENKAYWKYASKISFALHARDIYDQSKEEKNWLSIDFNDGHWQGAQEVANQKTWGNLSARKMPLLSTEVFSLHAIKHLVPLSKTEDIYSFSVPTPIFYEDNKGTDYKNYIAYSTWIYSPVEQSISVGMFWGEYWLNGQELPKSKTSETKSMRLNGVWTFQSGWNHFFGKTGIYADAIHIMFAFPKDKGIVIAADKEQASEYSFKINATLDKEIFNKTLANKPLPFLPDDNLLEAGGWTLQKKSDVANDAARYCAWDNFGEQFEQLTAEEIQGHKFPINLYPHGLSILIDMDYMHLGFPEILFKGTKGAIIDLTYSEHLMPDDMHLSQQFNYTGADRIFCTEDAIEWMASNPRGMRYFMITIRNAKEDILIEKLQVRSAQYPIEYKGRFECSDLLLNAIWKMCALTQEADMTDAYVDCCGREQGMYGRDTIIQYVNNLAIFGDHALMERCMQLYGQSPDATGKFRAVYPNTGDYTIADFALNMLEGYHVYYQNTGDKKRIADDWNAIMKNMSWFNQLADERDDMLLDAEWDLKRGIKAHYGGFHGDLHIKKDYMSIKGIHCVFSCTYLIAQRCALDLAKALGKQNDAIAIQKRIAVLEKSIQKFWNPNKKAFADNLNFETHSHHASLFAVRAGVVKPEQIDDLKRHVAFELRSVFVNGFDPSDGYLTSPPFAFYIFDGLYQLGLSKTAEDMMRIGWGWFLFQGCRTTPEYFTLDASLCHAWSASPTYYLSKNILGIHYPKAPDMTYVEIKVQTDSVCFAEGAFPHPKGLIEVKWHKDNAGKRVFDYVKTPEGVKAVVITE